MTETTSKAHEVTKELRQRLKYIDGLRAIAALYVVACHAMAEKNAIASWSNFAFISVSVFIVLSGYCLTIPYINNDKDFVLQQYLRRRALRLLPPYYMAIVFALLVSHFHPSNIPSSFFWQQSASSFNRENIVAHLCLTHNLSKEWAYGISFPLWSVATEWQIYFTLPFFLWIYAKRGALMTINASLIISATALYGLLHFTQGINPGHLELIALFSCGVVAAFAPPIVSQADNIQRRSVIVFIFSMTLLIVMIFTPSFAFNHIPVTELVVGIATSSALVLLRKKSSVAKTVLEWKPLVSIGVCSYSLYLIHAPILAVVHCYTPKVLLVGLPVSIALAIIFYLAVERPCINMLGRTAKSSVSSTDKVSSLT